MKFKKVEIQAFRAYDKVIDSTFDFELEAGRNADFVSIYAPNGFGKTSFYDAVEYGITKNIDRFIKNKTNLDTAAKSERNLSSADRQYILRNKFSDPKLPGFIRLTTTKDADPIMRDIPKASKGGKDFKFDAKDTIKPFFRQVILSQEWINAFLKDDTAAGRYETFVDYFGDKKIDAYYKTLSALIAANQRKIETLEDSLNGVQQELDFNGDAEILIRTNEQIDKLVLAGEHIDPIPLELSDTDEVKLDNSISQRLIELAAELAESQDDEAVSTALLGGSESIMGLVAYFEKHKVLSGAETSLTDKNKLLTNFVSLVSRRLLQQQFTEERKKLLAEQSGIKKLQGLFSQYLKAIENIANLEKERKTNSERSVTLITHISTRSESLKLTENERDSLALKLSELNKIKQGIPATEKRRNQNTKELNLKKREVVNINTKIKEFTKKEENHRSRVKALKAVIAQAEKGIYSSHTDWMKRYSAELIELAQTNERVKNYQNRLTELSLLIREQESINDDITAFLLKGAEIAQANQSENCPLCNYHYDSFASLAQKITENDFFSKKLSTLISERLSISEMLEPVKVRNGVAKKKLLEKLKQELAQHQQGLDDTVKELKEVQKSLDTLSKAIAALEDKESVQILEMRGLSLAKFIVELDGEIHQTEKALSLQSENCKLIQQELDKLKLDLDGIKISDQSAIDRLRQIREREEYDQITRYFIQRQGETDPSLQALNEDEAVKVERTLEISKQLKKLTTQIASLQKQLESLNKESLEKEVEKLRELIAELKRETGMFIKFANAHLDKDVSSYQQAALEKEIKEKRKKEQLAIKSLETRIQDFKLLEAFKANVKPYLVYQKAKQTEKEIKDQVAFQRNTVGVALSKERNLVATHIAKEIDAFFFTGLINDLYRRIDPHPEYKKIKFLCDFKDDKPKLNVCVYKEEDLPVIPNLYFSAAQLNILSLSIFLAKALNTYDDQLNPVDCIFIDDPIQSMDSINILSTIDLLRSIVVNLKKQIILSTHDENFHNLLKKKMPPGQFYSKFMELETFGKVKIAEL